jgi:hypothetical protein
LSYKSDKRDARASAGALERSIAKMHGYLQTLTRRSERNVGKRQRKSIPVIWSFATTTTPIAGKGMPIHHQYAGPQHGQLRTQTGLEVVTVRRTEYSFDNIVLVAADTNNEDHAQRLERLRCRGRILWRSTKKITHWRPHG